MLTRAITREVRRQAGSDPASTSFENAHSNHSTAPRMRALSQNYIKRIGDTALCGGCQNLSLRVNQLGDEIKQMRTALQGHLDAEGIKKASTARTGRSKTIRGRNKDTLKILVNVASAEKQEAKARDKKVRAQAKTASGIANPMTRKRVIEPRLREKSRRKPRPRR